jgi:adenylate kinase
MKNRLIGVTGLTGVGKDYLVTAANADAKIQTRNLGTIIGDLLSMNRDAMMQAATPDKIRSAQLQAYRQVVAEQPLIVTCHAIRPMQSGELGFDTEMEDIFDPMSYIFVQAPAELIQERVLRRNQSGERKSPELSVAEIADEQANKLALVQDLAGYLSTRLLVLDNVDEAYVQNVSALRSEINTALQPANVEAIA